MEDWEREGERAHEALAAFADGLVGQPKADAVAMCEDLGLLVRMVDWDLSKGPFALHDNYEGNRVTVFVKNGVVTSTQPG